MVYVLNVLSEVAPDWVRAHIPIEWVERYGQRLEEEREPSGEQERKQYANQVGTDGWLLLDALQAPCTPDWMKTLPAVTTLHTLWEQQFEAREQGGQWRQEPALPATQLITSPYDLDARNGKKRSTLQSRVQGAFYESVVMKMPHSSSPMFRPLPLHLVTKGFFLRFIPT
jgi:hypothetical protein